MFASHKTFSSLILAGLLAACAPTQSYWTEVQSPKTNSVEPVRLTHDLRLPAGGALNAEATAELDNFLARHDVGYGDTVMVVAAGGRGSAPLVDYLRRQGIAAQAVSSAQGREAPAGGARLVVERYVVVPPNCPDWSKPSRVDYGNTQMSNLGCANAANLGLMLADPRDLLQGRVPGDADGTASAAAVQRYRSDRVKPVEGTSMTSGGGGN